MERLTKALEIAREFMKTEEYISLCSDGQGYHAASWLSQNHPKTISTALLLNAVRMIKQEQIDNG